MVGWEWFTLSGPEEINRVFWLFMFVTAFIVASALTFELVLLGAKITRKVSRWLWIQWKVLVIRIRKARRRRGDRPHVE